MYVLRYKCHSQENKAEVLGHGARPRFHPEGKAYFRQFRRLFHVRPFIDPTGSPAGFLSFSHSLLGNTVGDLGHPHLKTLRQCPVGGDGNILDGPRFGGPQSF